MNIHIALYKWKPEAAILDINQALAQIASLSDKIPGIVEISCAENKSKYSEGYTHVILLRAEDQNAIDAYRSHPVHQKAAQAIETIEQNGIGVDFIT